MQEAEVGWDPVYVCGAQPWYTRLYGLYILIVIAFLIVRSIHLAINCWKLRTFVRAESSKAAPEFWYTWQTCNYGVKALKRTVVLTLFACAVVLTLGAYDYANTVRGSKAIGLGLLGGTLSELFFALALGLIVCTSYYAASALFSGSLDRHRAQWTYSCAISQTEDQAE